MAFQLDHFDHPINANFVQILTDGAKVKWLLTLSHDGHGAQIYRLNPDGTKQLVLDNGTWFMGCLYIGIDGNLHHAGGNADGTITLSDPIPGWTPLA